LAKGFVQRSRQYFASIIENLHNHVARFRQKIFQGEQCKLRVALSAEIKNIRAHPIVLRRFLFGNQDLPKAFIDGDAARLDKSLVPISVPAVAAQVIQVAIKLVNAVIEKMNAAIITGVRKIHIANRCPKRGINFNLVFPEKNTMFSGVQ
jgi:hypothetical protein